MRLRGLPGRSTGGHRGERVACIDSRHVRLMTTQSVHRAPVTGTSPMTVYHHAPDQYGQDVVTRGVTPEVDDHRLIEGTEADPG